MVWKITISWCPDGRMVPIWTSCEWGGGNIVMVTSIICQRYNICISSFLSDSVTSLQRKQSFLAMLELLSTVRWGLSSMNICKLDIFFLKTAVSQSNWLASSWYELGGNLGNLHLVLTICYVSSNIFWFLYVITLWSAFHLSSTWRNLNLICTLSVHISSRDIFVQCSNLSSVTSVLAEDSSPRIFEHLLSGKLLNFIDAHFELPSAFGIWQSCE